MEKLKKEQFVVNNKKDIYLLQKELNRFKNRLRTFEKEINKTAPSLKATTLSLKFHNTSNFEDFMNTLEKSKLAYVVRHKTFIEKEVTLELMKPTMISSETHGSSNETTTQTYQNVLLSRLTASLPPREYTLGEMNTLCYEAYKTFGESWKTILMERFTRSNQDLKKDVEAYTLNANVLNQARVNHATFQYTSLLSF